MTRRLAILAAALGLVLSAAGAWAAPITRDLGDVPGGQPGRNGGSVHPDIGGNTDESILLNNAKDVLMRHLDNQAPKLAKSLVKQAPKPRNVSA